MGAIDYGIKLNKALLTQIEKNACDVCERAFYFIFVIKFNDLFIGAQTALCKHGKYCYLSSPY